MRYYLGGLLVASTAASCVREQPPGDVSAASTAAESATSVASIVSDVQPRIFAGYQDSSGTRVCFESSDSTLAAGAPATVIAPDFPQHFKSGTLGRRSKRPCFPVAPGSVDSMEYAVDVPRDASEWMGVLILIVGKVAPTEMHGDTATLAVEAGQTPWRFRTCASTEGVHATAWSGTPLVTPRRHVLPEVHV